MYRKLGGFENEKIPSKFKTSVMRKDRKISTPTLGIPGWYTWDIGTGNETLQGRSTPHLGKKLWV
jgi:hypothetical protein